MGLRRILDDYDKRGDLLRVDKRISTQLEAAAILQAAGARPVLFTNTGDGGVPVAGNLYASRRLVADCLGIEPGRILSTIAEAIETPGVPDIVEAGPCQEVIEAEVDLDALPILKHFEAEGGRYITSAVFAVNDPELGHNLSVHRCMAVGGRKLAMRIVPRDLHLFLERAGGEIDAAACIGSEANTMLAASTSLARGSEESGLAAALGKLELVRATTIDVLVPAETEIVLEGRITKERHPEGPFIDITGTYDFVRQEPVFEVHRVTRRVKPVYQAILPAGAEHFLLMGMPRAAAILGAVSKSVRCVDVHLTPGGTGWLHAVLTIDKSSKDDGPLAIRAAFEAHSSLKHVFVVDADIDASDPSAVEWAMATRFQGDRDLYTFPSSTGSSLDPSADAATRSTCKAGFDLTVPSGADASLFTRAVPATKDLDGLLK